MHKKVIALAVFLFVAGLIGSAITAKGYLSEPEELVTAEFAQDQIHSISIDTDISAIEFLPSESDIIKIESFYGKNKKPAEAGIQQGTLRIKAQQQGQFQLGFNWKSNNQRIIVHLPKKNFSSITINNEVGKTILTEINAKTLTVETETGSVKLSRTSTGNLDVSTEVGSIAVDDSTGAMELESETGSIEVKTDALSHNLNASTEIGSIKVITRQLPENIFITAHSELGSTRILGEKTNSYKHGNAAYEAKLNTETGSIRVEQD